MLLSHGVLPLITLPTRVTDISATIIDHVLTNDFKHSLEPGVIQTQVISDHYALYCQIDNVPTYKKAEQSFGYYLDKSKFDSDTFNEDLNQTLANYFSSVPYLTLNNFNEIFNEFYRLISKTISQHAPLKRYSRRQRKLLKAKKKRQKKTWITKGILTSIKKKNFMFKTHFLYCNASQKLFFKRYSYKLTKIIAMSKLPISNLNCKTTKVTRKRYGKFCENYFLRREKHLKYLLLVPKSVKYAVTVA